LVALGTPRDALALWRGPPLHDVAGEPFAAAEIRRLEELRVDAIEDAIERDVAAGRHREVAAELEALVREEPLREALHAQRMLALYRCGRQAEALDAYREARTALVQQVGIEPGPELRRLHEEILRQDPSLEPSRERLDEAARRLAAERPALRAAEDELVGGIVALQAARGNGAAGGDVVVCPFKGLASFDVDDADFFFGRERLVAELVARQTGAPLTALVGASGSGKSSVLRAGVLASLRAGMLPGSERWATALLRPGEHPLRALDEATAEASPSGRLVVAVDQFEELFTACRDEDERAAFVDALVASARDPRRRAVVLLAIRADFYGRCAAYPELARLLAANQVLVGPMRRDKLRRAIELPARRAGLEVEPRVTDALLAGVEGAPGALPLLSTSLLELWQRREGNVLRYADYELVGGVEGAVARLAERAYDRLAPERRDVARRILLRLVAEGDGEAVVRRSAPLAELRAGDDVDEVLGVLADGRLVTVGDGVVEVAHEALLREWPRLRSWLSDDVEGRRLHRHLTEAAADWRASGHEPSVLYRGARLAAALEWTGAHDDELNADEREFVAQSRAAAELDTRRQRQANRRLRALLGGVAALLALAVVAGAVAVSQRGQAHDAALEADAARLGADGVTRDRLDDAMLLARAGIDLDDSVGTRSNLLSVLVRSPAALGTLAVDGWPLYAVGVSRDGRLVATGSERGTVTLFDAGSRRRLGTYEGESLVQSFAFSRDRRTLAVSQDVPPGAMLDILDVRTRRRLRRIVLPPVPANDGLVVAYLAFAPDDRHVIVVQGTEDRPSVVRRYDARTGTAVGRPLRIARAVDGLPATGDGRRLVATSAPDDETVVIDAERLRVLARFPVGGRIGAVTADGSEAALGSDEGEVRLLDLRSGGTRPLEGVHEGGIQRIAFARDGRTIVTSGGDGKIGLWDVADGGLRDTLSGHDRSSVYGLAVAPDGRSAYSGATDGRALVWDVAGDRRLDTPFDAGEPFLVADDRFPRGFAMSPDGRVLAQGQTDGTVGLVDTRTLRETDRFRALDGVAAGVAFSPDGRTLAVSGDRGELTLWDRSSLRRVASLEGLRTMSQAVAFSPDGRFVAAAELGDPQPSGPPDGAVRMWDVRRRALTSFRTNPILPSTIAFSPDGRRLAVAGAELGTMVLDARTGDGVARLRTDDFSRAASFSPDGTLVATGDFSGDAQLWSTQTWRPVGRRMEAHRARVQTLAFSPDGRTLATAAADGTVQLWDAASQKPIGSAVTVEPDAYLAAAFSPDGSQLFAVSEFERGIRLNVSVDAWKQHACRVAGRRITEREWQEALPERSYRPVCAGP
ncbi:MAG TPA: BTAD domain-containing putative transcriptional regulator, partial [Solirubrobacteraceae bacterium]|nr:BTAD domain-containing putative transcriptional regulator [Solirubrobacteraceae bacterium]